jgi:hypothetical protein
MAKRNKERKWSEAELITTFGLDKTKIPTPLMKRWLDATATLADYEQVLFDNKLQEAVDNIEAWAEEDLKMNFISFILSLSHLQATKYIRTFFDKTIEGTVEGHFLKTKTDFMIAKGVLDLAQTPYFHFQEYKKEKDPYGDPLAQLIEAFLIAQVRNQQKLPLFGCYIVGRLWYFATMEGKIYCVSRAFDSTQSHDLLHIIAVLRKFRHILETELLDIPIQ